MADTFVNVYSVAQIETLVEKNHQTEFIFKCHVLLELKKTWIKFKSEIRIVFWCDFWFDSDQSRSRTDRWKLAPA